MQAWTGLQEFNYLWEFSWSSTYYAAYTEIQTYKSSSKLGASEPLWDKCDMQTYNFQHTDNTSGHHGEVGDVLFWEVKLKLLTFTYSTRTFLWEKKKLMGF